MRKGINKNFSFPAIYFTIPLLLIYMLGIGLRLYDLTDPPLGYYPVRQLQGAIISRGIYYSWLPSPDEDRREQAINYWHSLGQHEPLILQSIVAATYLIVGGEIPWVAGLYNLIFWMIGGWALFALARRMTTSALRGAAQEQSRLISYCCALVALAYYMVLPFAVLESRSFQPDPGMVMWIILSAYALFRWSEEQSWKWAILAGVFSGLALLIKVLAIYPVISAILASVLYTLGPRRVKEVPISLLKMLKNLQLWAMVLLTMTPASLFYLDRTKRASEYFSAYTLDLMHLLLEPGHYLAWLKLVQSLVMPVTLLIAVAGLLIARGRSQALLLGLWVGYFIYGLTLPYQMGTHSYYHIELVPFIALSMVPVLAIGCTWLVRAGRFWQILLAGLGLVVLIYSSWQALLPIYRDNFRSEPAFWQTLAVELPTDDKTIALTQDFGFRLLYYGWRKVDLWPNQSQAELRDLRGKSSEFEKYFDRQIKDEKYFLVTDFLEFDAQPELKQILSQNYPLLQQSDGYILFDLSKKK